MGMYLFFSFSPYDPIGWYNLLTLTIIIFYSAIVSVLVWLFFKNDRRLLNTMPNVSISVGLFFTFLVLYRHLSQFEVETGTEPLVELIRKMSAAFSTSILGLFSSIVLNFLIKMYISYSDREKVKDAEYLQVSPQKLLYEIHLSGKQLAASSLIVNEQLPRINERLSGIDIKMNDLSSEVSGEIRTFLIEVRENIEAILKSIAEDSTRGTRELITQINADFLSTTLQLIKDNQELLRNYLAELLQELKGSLDNFSESYKDELSTLYRATAEMKEGLRASRDDFHTETKRIMNEHLEHLESTFKGLDTLQKASAMNLEETTRAFSDSVEQYRELSSEQQKMLAEVRKEFNNLEVVVKRIDVMLSQEDLFLESVQKMQNRIADIGNTIIQLQALNESLQELLSK
jgi:uncharacterized membrane protein